jgi:primosomal protein N' (replication factor Y)
MSSQQTLFDRSPEPWELDDSAEQLAAAVVFPEPPHGPYDYCIPASLRGAVRPGQRLQVPLGKGDRAVTGYCVAVETRRAGPRRLKDVRGIVDAEPLLSPAMLRLTQWMADYYLCPLGQVLQAVVPAGVRGQAGTREMTFLSVPPEIAKQLADGSLKLGVKQREALMMLAASPRPRTPPELAQAAKCTLRPIAELRKKKLVQVEVRRIYQMDLDEKPAPREAHLQLNDDQQNALERILAALTAPRYETILMHGVTGSGKTEVYIRAIDEVIRFGRQAIVLVPEISLTPQTRSRFRSRFEHVAVLHSHLSDAERHWHWQQIASGRVQVVVGARSAVFAPVRNLGLIVIDEEHDHSFKQNEAPRYQARDVALKRAQLEGIPLVLGSATPSLESWHEARQGRFTLVELPKRVGDRPLPLVATIDLRDEFRSRTSRGAVSRQLHQAIDQALAADGQVILLLNRRGYSTHIQCPACGYVAKCPDCDLPLTHHREGEKILCHWCDFQQLAPAVCPDCRFDGIRYSGLGTQKLEAEIKARFPGVPLLRMDSDTMQRPGAHEEALARFRDGVVRILVGTQMIAKGLDFPNVTLVGVINADTALHFPDFRAAERTFQLVTQVAGRTGRGDKGGRVLVQTFSPEHYAIAAAVGHDYHAFAAAELPVRRDHGYPPYGRMLRLIARGQREKLVEQFAQQAVERLRSAVAAAAPLEARVLGPAPCPIAKLRGKFRYHALLSSTTPPQLHQAIGGALDALEPPEDVQWIMDVDPVDLL